MPNHEQAIAQRRSRPTHRQPGKVRWCSFLWVLSSLVFVGSLAAIAGGFFLRNLDVVKAGALSFGAFLILTGISFIASLGLSCCVCANPVLTVKNRPKSAKAVKLPLGGYQLGIAFPALFTGKYRCMYCGEKITLSANREFPAGIHQPSHSAGLHSDVPICSAGKLPEIREKQPR